MASKSESGFGKDFGYLRPFLGKVEAHAKGLEGARGERLRHLLEGEAAKWDEIGALLAGGEPSAPPGTGVPTPEGRSDGPPADSDASGAAGESAVPREEMARGASLGLTVGSLRGDRRKTS